MDKDQKDLKYLIAELPVKSRAARLRSLLPIIDQRLKDGIAQEDILQLLHSKGLSINIHTFRSHLYRYRRFASLKANRFLPSENPKELQRDIEQCSETELVDTKKR